MGKNGFQLKTDEPAIIVFGAEERLEVSAYLNFLSLNSFLSLFFINKSPDNRKTMNTSRQVQLVMTSLSSKN